VTLSPRVGTLISVGNLVLPLVCQLSRGGERSPRWARRTGWVIAEQLAGDPGGDPPPLAGFGRGGDRGRGTGHCGRGGEGSCRPCAASSPQPWSALRGPGPQGTGQFERRHPTPSGDSRIYIKRLSRVLARTPEMAREQPRGLDRFWRHPNCPRHARCKRRRRRYAIVQPIRGAAGQRGRRRHPLTSEAGCSILG